MHGHSSFRTLTLSFEKLNPGEAGNRALFGPFCRRYGIQSISDKKSCSYVDICKTLGDSLKLISGLYFLVTRHQTSFRSKSVPRIIREAIAGHKKS